MEDGEEGRKQEMIFSFSGEGAHYEKKTNNWQAECLMGMFGFSSQMYCNPY